MKRTGLLISVCALTSVGGALAQSEAALKKAFEGKRVMVRMEMPATKWGVDVETGSETPIDYRQYSARIKEYGVALRPGDSVLVTGVKVKDKLIEFQLAGGGYGTVSDESDAEMAAPPSPKSRREKELEKAVASEKDPAKKKRMREELKDLRRERARDDMVAEAAAAEVSELRRQRIREKALGAGSRFNLRYAKGELARAVPTPEMVREALREWVEFGDSEPVRFRGRPVRAVLPVPGAPGSGKCETTMARIEPPCSGS